MKTKLHDENEIIALADGVLLVKGKTVTKDGRRVTHPDKTLRSMLEEAFRTEVEGDHPIEIKLNIGKGFQWDVEYEEAVHPDFYQVLLDMMDESDFEFDSNGTLTTRIRLTAVIE